MPLLTAQEPQSAPSMRIIHPCSVPAEVGSLPDSVSCPVRNNPVRYRILVWTSSLRCDSLLVRFTCRDLLLPTLPWFPSSPRTFSLGSSTSPELEPAQRDLHQTPRYRELRFFFHILFLPFSAAASQCFFFHQRSLAARISATGEPKAKLCFGRSLVARPQWRRAPLVRHTPSPSSPSLPETLFPSSEVAKV